MKMCKRVIAVLLCAIMLIGVLPMGVFATDDNTSATVENEMTSTGENPVAKAFSGELSTQSNQEETPYWITDVDIEDGNIIIEYSNLGKCNLLVAAYADDDNMKMLASEIVEVEENSETASIVLFDSLPKYYILKAFLLDSNYSALCECYTFTHMTKAFQDEFSKTTDDFDSERVINVDESKDENFFVLNEKDKIIQGSGTKNVYNESASSPSENKYVFDNCDSSLKSVKAGDIFYLKNNDNENLLVIKVKSVTSSGNTVTIIADDMDLEEAFVHIDLDIDVGLQDGIIEEGYADDGVVYEGREEDNSGLGTQGVEYGDKFGWKDKFSVQKEFEADGGNVSAKIKLSATVELGLEGNFKAYVSLGYKEVSFKMSAKAGVTLSISGKADAYIPLCPGIDFSPVPGLFIGLKPAIKIELSAEISVSGTLTFTLGVGWDTNNGFQNKSKGPEFKPEVKVEGKFFIGLDLRPRVYVVAESVAKAELSGTVGLEIKATMSTENVGNGDSSQHDCCLGGFACIDGDISVKLKIGAGISFGEGTWLEIKKEATIWDKSLHIADFYYSIKYNEFGWGNCPHLEYKLTLTIKDSSGNPIKGAKVLDLTTDDNGQVSRYYPPETTVKYVVIANGYSNVRGSLYVRNSAVSKTITMQVGVSDPTETVDPNTPVDPDPNVGSSDGTGSNDGIESATIIRFGSYPQSRVTDTSTISTLNSKASGWKSYNYYEGDGSYGSMHSSDYMRYCDVKYGNNKYRGVIFDTYRPYWTEDASTTSCGTYQDDNGYTYGTVYWFKYEPLRWRILDASTGLVMCETIIDSQPYNNYIISSGTDSHGNTAYWGNSAQTYYASDYANSSIRKWLTEDFYATAFSSTQQSKIKTTTLNNDGYYTLTGTTGYEDYDSVATSDKIFLLSYDEVLNSSYGFSTGTGSDSARQAKGSDYAKCQGLYVYNSSGSSYDGCSNWRLRSPGYGSDGACYVGLGGFVYSYFYYASVTGDGVRPALKLNLSSLGTQSTISTQAVSGTGIFDYSYSACEAGGEYILLNVTGYGNDFVLKSSNLEYIDQLTADASGKVSGKFMPRKAVSGSTTLLIGNFGNGTEARKLTVTEETTGTPDPVIPDINIKNYKSSISVDYKAKLVFHTDIEAPAGHKIVWSNGDEGSTCTIDQAVNGEYKIKADLVRISDNKVIKSTQVEVVKVNTGFFAKIIAFFRGLFNVLPIYEDNSKK